MSAKTLAKVLKPVFLSFVFEVAQKNSLVSARTETIYAISSKAHEILL